MNALAVLQYTITDTQDDQLLYCKILVVGALILGFILGHLHHARIQTKARIARRRQTDRARRLGWIINPLED